MRDEHYEWDDDKAAKNARSHQVTFETARDVFGDVFAIEWVDHDHDDPEDRYVILGMVDSRLLYVSYTLRGPRTRIISARLAEPYERRKYHNANRT